MLEKKVLSLCRHLVCGNVDLSSSIILCNNCIGGFLYHDFKEEFKSPTINLQIETEDFLRFCNDLEGYLGESLIEYNGPENEIIFKEWNTHPFPIAYLKDVKIYFQHYDTFEKAREAWEKRSNRTLELLHGGGKVNVIMMSNNFKQATFADFEKLPFSNKIYIYTSDPDENVPTQIPDVFALKIPKGKNWYQFSIPPFFRYYDQFDFKHWLI